jgi:hypothetical protein
MSEGRYALGALTALTLWLFVGLPLYYGPRTDDSGNQCSRQEEKNYGFWEKTRCDPIAYFTVWLVGFTGVLALVSVGQGILLFRGDKTARTAAESSRISARASVASLLPVIHVEGVNASDWRDDTSYGIGKSIAVGTVFANSGGGIASVIGMRSGSYLGDKFDLDFAPDRVWKLKDGLFIAPNPGRLILNVGGQVWVSAADFERIRNGDATF